MSETCKPSEAERQPYEALQQSCGHGQSSGRRPWRTPYVITAASASDAGTHTHGTTTDGTRSIS